MRGGTHYVYRCFDRDGQLLYIGCTSDIGHRMRVHWSNWNNPASAYLSMYMDRYEVEEVVGFAAARKAEREAIAAEAPLLNVHHNKGRGLGLMRGPAPTGPVTGDFEWLYDSLRTEDTRA